MITGEFNYFAPPTVQEAASLLVEHGSGAKILAGGQSLIPAMRFRLSMPETIIDINQLTGLQYIREDRTPCDWRTDPRSRSRRVERGSGTLSSACRCLDGHC